jgi:predicted dithiol-disulfide oxidoreductase (DUF899 family)
MSVKQLPNESLEYRKVRDELLEAEIALKDQVGRVAALRRRLPADTVIEDCGFEELRDGQTVAVRLSELFDDPNKPLLLMHFMQGKKQQDPCPMCTLWADGYNALVPHLEQRVNFAVLVAGGLQPFIDYASGRGWNNLRIVSAADSDLKLRLGFEGPEGDQHPGVSVFRLEADQLTHFTSMSAMMDEGHFNGMDLLSPFWHFLDLTPEGREDFFPKASYDVKA